MAASAPPAGYARWAALSYLYAGLNFHIYSIKERII